MKIIKVNVTNRNVGDKNSNNSLCISTYALYKFLKDLIYVFSEETFTIILGGEGDPALFPEELEIFLKNKIKAKICTIAKLLFKADMETIRILEKSDQIIVPFKEKYPHEYLLNFAENINKINKDKVVAYLDLQKYFRTSESLLKNLKVIKGLGIKNITIDFSLAEKYLNILRSNFNIIDSRFYFQEDFIISELGIISYNNKTFSIFKPIADFIFNIQIKK